MTDWEFFNQILRLVSAAMVSVVFIGVVGRWRKLWSGPFQAMFISILSLAVLWRWAAVFWMSFEPSIRRFFTDGTITAVMVILLSSALLVSIVNDYRGTFRD